MKLRLFLITVLILLFSVSLASAFTIYPDPNIDSITVCPRETGLFKDSFMNSGSIAEKLTISFSGNAGDWATVAPKTFDLDPADVQETYVYVTPGKDAAAGIYDLLVTAETSKGVSKTINHKIMVKDCHKVDVVGSVAYAETCPSQEAKYSFTVVNNGEYIEGYSLSVSGLDVKLSDTNLVLNPGQSQTIYAYTKAPVDSGEYTFTVSVKGSSSEDNFVGLLKVNSCYAFDLDVQGGGIIDVCDHSASFVPINLQNLGTTSNRYDVTVEGPNWVDVTRKSITMNSGLHKSFHAVFKPDYGIEGNYSARINILPSKGEAKAYVDFGINVRKCHAVELTLENEYYGLCSGSDAKTNKVVVKNTGEFAKNYNLDVSDFSWLSVDGEAKEYTLEVLVDYNRGHDTVKSTKTITVLKGDSATEPTDGAKLIVNPSATSQAVQAGEGAVYKVNIANLGSESATLGFEVSGVTGWGTYSVDPASLTVAADSTSDVTIYVSPSEDATSGVKTFTLTVKDGANALTQKVFNLEVKEESGADVAKDVLLYVFIALLIILVLVAIVAVAKKVGSKESEPIEGQTYY